MNPGLRLLALRLARGRIRLIGRRMRTVRGAIGIGGTVLFLLAFAALQVWRATTPGMRGGTPSPETLRTFVPALVTVLTIIAAVSERGLYFSPAETGFLFPAPVGRRELLLYNLVTRLGIQVLSGLWVSVYTVLYAPLPAAGFAAVMLAFVFMYVAAQALALGAMAAESYLSPLVRRLVRAAVIAGVLLIVASAAMSAAPGTAGQRFRVILESPVVRAVSIVARPFGELFAATTAGAAIGWGIASMGLIALAALLVLSFDVAYTERSLAVGQRVQRRLSRMLSTSGDGEGAAAGPPPRFRLRAPRVALPGRAGPLAWRQMTELLRTPRALVSPLIFGAVWLVAMFGGIHASEGDAEAMQTSVLTTALLMPVIFGNPLPFDFRRDLDRMAFLRSLPLRPVAVAVGQIFPAAVFFALFELLVMCGAAALTGAVPAGWMVVAAALVLPVAWCTAALENLLFLWMPYRVGPDGRAGAQFLGKALLLMLMKVVTLGIVGFAGFAAWYGMRILGAPLSLALIAAALAMSIPCIPLTWWVGRTFARFDLTRAAAAP
ncbi:putative ABC exporter domain-containing protein [Longimicrobium sp.]|uniref:putative ABC exporter domain-containing protein n=1 Tax=Longimicrobium sp. TaxID=2029185 RepID=UPI002C35AE3F|nr:putative ABC exporter domain-containing protein [Longimicrobium sp.]HSU14505.1 putative ABC exporter domain-containing protein [Longimicrobium sp.]